MGRPKRIQFAGACYYIVLRGNNRQDIFLSNQDRRQFLAMLKQYKDRFGLKIYAYCLLAHDAHLLVETPLGNLGQVMQGFNTTYTKYFNGAHNTVGHVFQGRYKALIVDKERYLCEMTRFVHLQPVREGLKDKPWRYAWSSCQAYVESVEGEPLVDSETILARFAKMRLKQSVRYLHYIKERLKSASHMILPVSRGLVVGDEAFLERVLALDRQAPLSPAARGAGAPDPRKLLAEIAAKHGIDEQRLVGRMQWRDVTSIRRKAIYQIWRETRLGVTELSRIFNRTPSAVSQVIRAMETGKEA